MPDHEVSVDMTEAHYAAATTAVESGEFASISDVVRAAMSEWLERSTRKAYRTEDVPDHLVQRLERIDIPAAHKAHNDEIS